MVRLVRLGAIRARCCPPSKAIANWFIQVNQQSPIVRTPRLQMFNHIIQIESRKKARLLQQLSKPRLDVIQTPQLLGNRSAQRVVNAARDLMRAEERVVAAGKPLDAGKRVPQRDVAKWRHSHHHLAPKTHGLRDASFQQLSPFGPSPHHVLRLQKRYRHLRLFAEEAQHVQRRLCQVVTFLLGHAGGSPPKVYNRQT